MSEEPKQAWAKEPWDAVVDREHGVVQIRDSSNKTIIFQVLGGWESDKEEDTETIATLQRIVACVNALAGIDDPAGFVEHAKNAIMELDARKAN